MSQQLLVYKKAREKSRFFFIFFDLSVFMQKAKYKDIALCTFPIFFSFYNSSKPCEISRKNPALQDSPPAAGCSSDIISLCHSAILPGGLFTLQENSTKLPV
jgi:hypothetical protein